MVRFHLGALAGALLLVCGCGGEGPEPAAPARPARPSSAGRGASPSPRGPAWDAAWRARAPADLFLYAAVSDAEAHRPFLALLGEGRPTPAAAPGLPRWLRALRDEAPARTLFPEGAALGLGPRPAGASPGEASLDFWLVTPSTPGLGEALDARAASSGGRLPAPEGFPGVHRRERDGLVVLSSREAWADAPPDGPPTWVAEAWAATPARVGAYLVWSPSAYQQGSVGEALAARSPGERAWLERFGGSVPYVALAARALGDDVRVELRAPLDPSHPGAEELRALFDGEDRGLRGPRRVPAVSSLYLGASWDWEAWGRLRGEAPGDDREGAAREEGPASAFATPSAADPAAPSRPADLTAAVQAGVTWLRATLQEALRDWAGPEVSLALQWETRWPRLGLLVENHEPKRAARAVQRFHEGEVGRRLRFVDRELAGVPFRYTRLDGEDPDKLEPAYGFVGPFLMVSSHRRQLEAFLDDEAPKLEGVAAMGGVVARLGSRLRLAAYLRPALLGHLREVLRASAEDGTSPLPPLTSQILETFEGEVSGIAAGLGWSAEEGLEGVLLVTRHPAAEDAPRPAPGR